MNARYRFVDLTDEVYGTEPPFQAFAFLDVTNRRFMEVGRAHFWEWWEEFEVFYRGANPGSFQAQDAELAMLRRLVPDKFIKRVRWDEEDKMRSREELQAIIQEELAKALGGYTKERAAEILKAVENTLRQFAYKGIIPSVPDIECLQSTEDPTRILVVERATANEIMKNEPGKWRT